MKPEDIRKFFENNFEEIVSEIKKYGMIEATGKTIIPLE